MNNRLYVATARVWTVVFFCSGLTFLLFPGLTGQSLTALANALGFPGLIVTPPGGTLWWALTLSLMATITVLAGLCAVQPAAPGPYWALMTAKVVSTLGFAGLALWLAPAWVVCAVGDGFVALTLWLARSRVPRLALPPGFARRYNGAAPFAEEYFGKVDIAPGRALWFRYTLLDGKDREAAVWGILFDGDQVTAAKHTWKLGALAPGNAVIVPPGPDAQRFDSVPQVFSIGGSRLDPGNAVGQAGDLSWDLRLNYNGRSFSHVPAALRATGLISTSYDSSMIDLRISGTIRAGEQLFVVDEVTGMAGHIAGRKKAAHAWVWAHCNLFDGEPDAVFEGLSAFTGSEKNPRGPLTSLVLFTDGRRYAFNAPWRLAQPSSQFNTQEWTFRAQRGGVVISGRAVLPERPAVVEYTGTDGSKLWCRNSKLADLTVRLQDPAAGIDRTFRASGTAAFEYVDRVRPDREVDVR